MTEEEYIDVIIENIFATEHRREYKREYYMQHKDYHLQKYQDWCKENPVQAKAIQDRWRASNPHYQRDYQRKRKAATESLIFEFLDNGFGSDIDGYISYLRNRGIPKQHIKWFQVDVRKHLEKSEEEVKRIIETNRGGNQTSRPEEVIRSRGRGKNPAYPRQGQEVWTHTRVSKEKE